LSQFYKIKPAAKQIKMLRNINVFIFAQTHFVTFAKE